MVAYVYKITNTISGRFYFGITKTSIEQRWKSHQWKSKEGRAPINCAIRSYGADAFTIEPIVICEDSEYAGIIETALIACYDNLYNLHPGGAIGHDMSTHPQYDEWRAKLSVAREGRKPALGMKHTDENKALFKKVSREYWDTQDLYDIDAISRLSLKEAKEQFGISQTHYYRLRKGSRSDK